MRFLANFLEPRLVQSRTTVIVPLNQRIIFVRFLDRSEFSSPQRSPKTGAITQNQPVIIT
jgi:hypothetical protein